jgi:4'-phosphopantetheinyl transferase
MPPTFERTPTHICERNGGDRLMDRELQGNDRRMASALTTDSVVVWWMAVRFPPADTVRHWHASLDKTEQDQADRFHFAVDREAYIAAHALMRALLADIGGLTASAWRFVTGPFGKPEIDPELGRSQLSFNLSHTKGLVACAVGLENDLGVDVEACDRIRDAVDIADRFFSPEEVALLRHVGAEQTRDTFLRIWTLKEAYIKATGQGLSCPLDSFAFELEPVRIRFRAAVADNPDEWQFAQWRPTSRHVIAVAVRARSRTPMRVIERAVDPGEI